MVGLLILVAGGDRSFGWGNLIAGGWGREYGGNWTEQGEGMRVIRVLRQTLGIIDGRGMDYW